MPLQTSLELPDRDPRNNVGRGSFIDHRMVILGAMLPDLLDKPLGWFAFPEFFGTGRLYGHTLLFFVVLLLAGILVLRNRGGWPLLALAFGVGVHLALDGAWLSPVTFFWPSEGWTFPCDVDGVSLSKFIDELIHDPYVYIPELLGGMVLLMVSWYLLNRKRVSRFLCTGRI
jgi:inner membrane protein